MPLQPVSVDQCFSTNEGFIDIGVNPDVQGTLIKGLESLVAGATAVRIDDFLTAQIISALDELGFNATNRVPTRVLDASFEARSLLEFMLSLTLVGVPTIGARRFGKSSKKLVYNPADLKIHTLCGRHVDSGGTHSVILNRKPVGSHEYQIDGFGSIPITDNQLVIIGGRDSIEDDEWISAVHSVVQGDISEDPSILSRERILVSSRPF